MFPKVAAWLLPMMLTPMLRCWHVYATSLRWGGAWDGTIGRRHGENTIMMLWSDDSVRFMLKPRERMAIARRTLNDKGQL